MTTYQTKRCIFEGGWSQVYLATDTKTGTDLVVKQLRELYPSAESMARFSREFEITRSAAGPHVIEAFEFHAHEGTVGITLEDFGGRAITELLRSAGGRLETEQALGLAIQVADGLSHVHSLNIVHKDINPSNVVYNPDTGVAKLIDFGISQVLSRTSISAHPVRRFAGTPAYMSPEQTGRMNRDLDPRSDLYSLGITLYEMLTGHTPFQSDDPLELVHSHIARSPVSPKEFADIPDHLSELIMILLSKRAEDRYNTAKGLRHDLMACLASLKSGQGKRLTLREADSDGRLRVPQKLYGREAETEQLMAAFDRAANGEVALLLVAGYSGVGKTSLVHEVHRPLVGRRGIFVEGKFDQLNRGTPYDSLIQAFRSFIRQVLTEPEDVIAQWKEAILAAVGEAGKILVDVIPELEHILGPQPEVEVLAPAEARNRFQLVMGSFLRAIGSAEHPLVLFLDDLQWADLPSIELIASLATDPRTSHVLFIGAYRDNEVSPSHPLMTTIEEMKAGGANVEEIMLAPLREEHVLELVADTVANAPGHLRLALICYEKTRGNAFFLNRFLESLHSREILRFEAPVWTWDMGAIQASSVTDNVVEFMTDEILKLEESGRRALQVAACIGNSFDLNTLTYAQDLDPKTAMEGLRAPLHQSMVQPSDESFWYAESTLTEGTNFEYRFAHDRIQQAAYAMLDEEQATALHLRVGRYMLEHLEQVEQDPRLFALVEHMNRGASLLNADERRHLGELNLQAGRRATQSAAFEPAHGYYLRAFEELKDSDWEERYEISLAVHLEGARAAFLSGRYAIMDERVNAVMKRGRTLLDRVNAQEVRIMALVSQQKLQEAVNTALSVIAELGFDLLCDPTREDVQAAVGEALALLEGHDEDSLRALPEATDPKIVAGLRIQNGIISSAYLAVPNLLPLLCCSMVKKTLKHGVSAHAVYGFSTLGLVLVSVNMVPVGYQVGKLALAMLERWDDRGIRLKNLHVVGGIVNAYVEPLRKALDNHRQVYRLGIEAGDLEYAAWGLHNEICNSFWAGLNLNGLAGTATHHVAILEHHKQIPALACTEPFVQIMKNLRFGEENSARLIGSEFDEREHLERLRKTDTRGPVFVCSAVGTVCRYLFRDLQGALDFADETGVYADGAQATYLVIYWNQYRALAALGLCSPETDAVAGVLKNVAPNRELLKSLADSAPHNFLHRVQLLDAEVARLEGRHSEALDLYEAAIAGARKNEFTHDEALANELAGRCLLEAGRKTPARGYLMESIFVYTRWGALAKAAHLEEEFAELLAGVKQLTTSRRPSPARTTGTSSLEIDLTAVVRASQAVSRNIVLVELVQALVRLALEVGGAQRGLLLLLREGKWTVVCEGIAEQQITLQTLDEPMQSYGEAPQKILEYVRRTREEVILGDAGEAELFRDDEYVTRRSTKSVLCLAVKQQNQLNAILYLENDLTTRAFTDQQLDLLRVLASQAAISLENAQLYDTLEKRVEDRTRELQLEIKERTRVQEELRVLATTDSMTGASNRRHFLELAEQEFKRSRRYPAPLSTLMLDADHFKSVNDRYGHETGDKVLKALAAAVSAELRVSEIFGRMGGEEFAIVLPATSAEGAAVLGERIRQSISQLEMPTKDGVLRFTVSIGVSELSDEDTSFSDLLNRADEALYRAKAGGRNQVVQAPVPSKSP